MIAGVVRDSRSYAQAAAKLGLRGGGNHSRLKGRIERSGIDTSHFVGKAWRKDRHRPNVPATPLEVLLVEGRPTLSNDLKKRLILAGLKKWRCETCGRDRWNGRPIPLELDHVNGKRDDNRLTNLRLLCPNCHAQTPTYRGRNIGVGIAYAE